MQVRLDPGPRAVVTSDLSKRFGETSALDGLDLEVPEGAVYVLVGPNGAGKTTTLRVLTDLLRPDSGHAEVFGMSTLHRPAEIRSRVGFVPEMHVFHYGWMEVRDLLRHHRGYFEAWDDAYATELVERLSVPPGRRFAELSKGEARRVQLVLALAHRPPLLLLDEPTDGLDPAGKQDVLGLIADHLASTPTTVLICTHLVYETERLADHLGVMKSGRLTTQISRDDLERRMKRYLVDTPDGVPPGGDDLQVLDRKRAGREVRLTVWGDEEEVVRSLEDRGATVRDVMRLSLEEAAVTLIQDRPADEGGTG